MDTDLLRDSHKNLLRWTFMSTEKWMYITDDNMILIKIIVIIPIDMLHLNFLFFMSTLLHFKEAKNLQHLEFKVIHIRQSSNRLYSEYIPCGIFMYAIIRPLFQTMHIELQRL